MNTNFGRFKMLALQAMAADGLKDDVKCNTTEDFDVVHVYGFVGWKSPLYRTLGL